jgi:hypothetical protein
MRDPKEGQAGDDLDKDRKLFEESLSGLKAAIFEATRAPTVNRYKLEEALKRYFDRQLTYLGKLHDRIAGASARKAAQEQPAPVPRGTGRHKI